MSDPLDTSKTPKAAKGTKAAKADKPTKAPKAAKAAKADKPAKAAVPAVAPKPRKEAADVSAEALPDKQVIAAVRKLKEPKNASVLASELGVVRRVLRRQLQRLAADKESGVQMKKDGFHWIVSTRA